jgi:hypothetical protein
MATIVEREASASRERLDGEGSLSATHLRMHFPRCDDRDGAHMYVNISATHT